LKALSPGLEIHKARPQARKNLKQFPFAKTWLSLGFGSF
jgi:hypothetical protein